MSPSVALAAILVFFRMIFRYKCVIDTHNAGLALDVPDSKILTALVRWNVKGADLTIVTNEALADHVRCMNGRPFVLPDRLPELPIPDAPKDAAVNDPQVVFVCTFSNDEPYMAAIEAARQLSSSGISSAITGNYHNVGIRPSDYPETIRITGFIPESQYVELLAKADIVVDLTTRDDCLVCGAYEALSLGKPIVLSDTTSNRHFFSKGAVYVKNDAGSIAQGIIDALTRRPELELEVHAFTFSYSRQWESLAQRLSKFLGP